MKGAPVNMLFIAGPGRSGTTAFAEYLNRHPQILVCIERYKHIGSQVSPGLFTFDRILDYREGETNVSRERHEKLLEKKDPEKLRWIGDKAPGYVRSLQALSENNPGARFAVMYRPIEEVAESYEARSRNPNDRWLGGKNGFEIGIEEWNEAMRNTRRLIKSGMGSQVLLVDYHAFFYDNETCIPLISWFLDMGFGERIRESWSKTSSNFEDKRRHKEPLSDEQQALISQNKDHEIDEWARKRIQKQWDLLEADSGQPEEASAPAARVAHKGRDRLADSLMRLELESQTLKTRRLEQRLKELEDRFAEQEKDRDPGPDARDLMRRKLDGLKIRASSKKR